MAPVVTMKQLLDAGVHFGHQTRRWNPKMKRFIYGERQGIYIIDLEQTLDRIKNAYEFVRDLTADGGNLLFVGTKKQASDSVEQYAMSCNMPYVSSRWLGGMLTNFETISKRVSKMAELERQRDTGEFDAMPKKEALMNTRELDKLYRNLNGIRNLDRRPDAVFVLDTKKEHIAVTEANKLGIPVVAVVDTNCDPDVIDYVIPGNDDAIRSGTLLSRVISDAVIEGKHIASLRTPVATRSSDDEARVAAEQAEARRQALAEARERDARVAGARTTPRPPAAPSLDSPTPQARASAPAPPRAEGAAADDTAATDAAASEAADATDADEVATEPPVDDSATEAAAASDASPAEAAAGDGGATAPDEAESPTETSPESQES
jgi:small subunit ribosomal protein S2